MTVKFIDLGWITAKFDTGSDAITFMYPSICANGAFCPASSILLCGEGELKRLRDELVAAYPLKKDTSV